MSNLYPIQRIPSYSLVDPAIRDWCSAHSLTLYTTYKDYDVRTVDVVDWNKPAGKKCQIWIDPPKEGMVTVNVWPYAPPHEKMTVPVENISAALEDAYVRARELLGM